MNKKLTFELKEHTFSIEFPNNRQYVAIHNMKAMLSPQYESLQYMGAESEFATVIVDAVSHLSVLCPDIIKSLQVLSLMDLDMKATQELVKVYTEKIRPWYNEWLNDLFEVPKAVKVEKEKIDKGEES